MQRDIGNKNTLGDTLNSIDDIRQSTAIDLTTSTTMMPKKRYKKYAISLKWENTMQTWQNIFLVSWI